MVAIKGPQQAGPETESAEDLCAVATITRLIHHLYAANGSGAVFREARDSELIKWSDILGAVRRR